MKELRSKILEALLSALPITLIVYIMALLPWFDFSTVELITFTVGAVLLILGIGLFNMGADLAMTPMGTHVGAGLSRQKKLGLLLSVCFVLGMLITIAEPDLQVLANQVKAVMNGTLLIYTVGVYTGNDDYLVGYLFLNLTELQNIFDNAVLVVRGAGTDDKHKLVGLAEEYVLEFYITLGDKRFLVVCYGVKLF